MAEKQVAEHISAEEYSRTMEAYQQSLPVGGVSREVNRRQVTNTILETFHLVGGVSSFALWARNNPDAFYQMWAKQAPRFDIGATDTNEMKIIHVIPPSPLDQ